MRYHLKYTTRDGAVCVTDFRSLSARTLWIMDHALVATVLSTWESHAYA